jgi:hypothetical protein
MEFQPLPESNYFFLAVIGNQFHWFVVVLSKRFFGKRRDRDRKDHLSYHLCLEKRIQNAFYRKEQKEQEKSYRKWTETDRLLLLEMPRHATEKVLHVAYVIQCLAISTGKKKTKNKKQKRVIWERKREIRVHRVLLSLWFKYINMKQKTKESNLREKKRVCASIQAKKLGNPISHEVTILSCL